MHVLTSLFHSVYLISTNLTFYTWRYLCAGVSDAVVAIVVNYIRPSVTSRSDGATYVMLELPVLRELLNEIISYFDGLMQDASISSALAMELLQSCTKPSMCYYLPYAVVITADEMR